MLSNSAPMISMLGQTRIGTTDKTSSTCAGSTVQDLFTTEGLEFLWFNNMYQRLYNSSAHYVNLNQILVQIGNDSKSVSRLTNSSQESGVTCSLHRESFYFSANALKHLKLFPFLNLVTQIPQRITDIFPCYLSCQKCLKN